MFLVKIAAKRRNFFRAFLGVFFKNFPPVSRTPGGEVVYFPPRFTDPGGGSKKKLPPPGNGGEAGSLV